MEKKIFYNVEDVMTMLMISKSHAYKIIRELNQDLVLCQDLVQIKMRSSAC